MRKLRHSRALTFLASAPKLLARTPTLSGAPAKITQTQAENLILRN